MLIGGNAYTQSPEEKEVFELVLSISGVGAKVALSILSSVSVDQFRSAIARGNMAVLTKVPGIGKKSAQRMVLELKDKIGRIRVDEDMLKAMPPESGSDAVLALLNLGASQSAAEYAVFRAERLLGENTSIEEVITEALKLLGS